MQAKPLRMIATATVLASFTLAAPRCWTAQPWDPLDVSACQRLVSTLAEVPLTNNPQLWGTGDHETPFRLDHDGICKLTLYRDPGSPHAFGRWAISDYESEIIELVRECVAGGETRGGTVGVGPGNPSRFFLNMANANVVGSGMNASSLTGGAGPGGAEPAVVDTT
ncbi:MAG: hypothetical protein OHK93_007211 [Ramalina farinacea]|uniref:Secreted protein n=1 Tax=Ramalina farinacea TaxID=258253 RepID=A0AA43TXE3_9LECA|nr:hypothetical protein [Ramalina farinacea]